jgi:hypothetical protein
MKKLIAIAALATATFAVPALPVQAATLADVVDSCLVLPLLKKECWPEPGERPLVVTTSPKSTDKAISWPVPAWWNCSPAADGAKYLFECE